MLFATLGFSHVDLGKQTPKQTIKQASGSLIKTPLNYIAIMICTVLEPLETHNRLGLHVEMPKPIPLTLYYFSNDSSDIENTVDKFTSQCNNT